jgi:hypothetical protein
MILQHRSLRRREISSGACKRRDYENGSGESTSDGEGFVTYGAANGTARA